MGINRRDLKLDALAYLYRSSYYMALGNCKLSLTFFNKASDKFIELKKIRILGNKKTHLLEAEKILDAYHRCRTSLV